MSKNELEELKQKYSELLKDCRMWKAKAVIAQLSMKNIRDFARSVGPGTLARYHALDALVTVVKHLNHALERMDTLKREP